MHPESLGTDREEAVSRTGRLEGSMPPCTDITSRHFRAQGPRGSLFPMV